MVKNSMLNKLITTSLLMLITIPAFASVAVSPTRIEINANKLKGNYYTKAIEIKGDTRETMRFKAYTGFFDINEKSEMVMIDDSKDNPCDISKKIKFVPSEFTITEGKTQKLRINIANLNQLKDGENRAVIYIEDVNPKEQNIPTYRSGIGAQLIIKTRIAIPVYVDKGKIKKEGIIESLEIINEGEELYTKTKIVSSGNSKIRYNAKVQIIDNKKLVDEYSLNGKVVGANNYYIDKQKINTRNMQDNKNYTLRMLISYFDENDKKKILKKETIINKNKMGSI